MRHWLGSDPWPKVFAIVTVTAFGGTIAIAGIRPWGLWGAVVLMAGWSSFAVGYSVLEARREGHLGVMMTFRERLEKRPVAVAIHALLALVILSVWGRQFWLIQTDAPRDQRSLWSAIFWALIMINWVAGIIVAAIYHHLERRRQTHAD